MTVLPSGAKRADETAPKRNVSRWNDGTPFSSSATISPSSTNAGDGCSFSSAAIPGYVFVGLGIIGLNFLIQVTGGAASPFRFGYFLLAVAALVIQQSIWVLRLFDHGQPGSGFMPFGLGVILAILAVCLIAANLGPDERRIARQNRECRTWRVSSSPWSRLVSRTARAGAGAIAAAARWGWFCAVCAASGEPYLAIPGLCGRRPSNSTRRQDPHKPHSPSVELKVVPQVDSPESTVS